MRLPAVLVFSLVGACADPLRPLPLNDLSTAQGELSLPFDLGDDLNSGRHDLSMPDLTPPNSCGVGQLEINELQTRSSANTTVEWVELYNPCPNAVALAGATLKYRSATNSTAADTSLIANLTGSIVAGGYYLAAKNYVGPPAADVTFVATTGLLPTGGAVGLRDAAGALVDGVGWGNANNPFVEGGAAINPAPGHSIARKPNGADTNVNSVDFVEVATPTPRAMN